MNYRINNTSGESNNLIERFVESLHESDNDVAENNALPAEGEPANSTSSSASTGLVLRRWVGSQMAASQFSLFSFSFVVFTPSSDLLVVFQVLLRSVVINSFDLH